MRARHLDGSIRTEENKISVSAKYNLKRNRTQCHCQITWQGATQLVVQVNQQLHEPKVPNNSDNALKLGGMAGITQEYGVAAIAMLLALCWLLIVPRTADGYTAGLRASMMVTSKRDGNKRDEERA